MSSNKFAAALKPAKPQPAPVMADVSKTATDAAVAPSSDGKPSRTGTKHIGAYFDPAVSKQLRQIGLQEDTTVQDLLAEAIDMLFQSRQKPMIAKKQVQA